VILCEDGAVAGVDIRGGAPGTREIACLDPVNMIGCLHGLFLGGGSAFGLDGAAGVMAYLEEQHIGFDVGVTRVPIVPGAVLFDLPVGNACVRPDKTMGYTACQAATTAPPAQGNVGAGTGATVGKASGSSFMMKGGLGTASCVVGELIVGAIVAVNCFGDIIDPSTGEIIAGTLAEDRRSFADTSTLLHKLSRKEEYVFKGNTTIGAIATNAALTKAGATKIAMMAHDGYARAIKPVHTMYDGDTIFCISTGSVEANITTVGAIAAETMARAVLNGIRSAETLFGIPGLKTLQQKEAT
jgi:L-aminopeptidase/D-esterase-like protein